ncbi:MAG: MBL fold metallo-hydrolase [Pseudomonadota bacterium]
MTVVRPHVVPFFHRRSGTLSYLVHHGKDALIIDPVIDYDPVSGQLCSGPSDEIAAAAERLDVNVHWVIDTHAHADHLSGAYYLKTRFEAKLGMGRGIQNVHATFAAVFNDQTEQAVPFDAFFEDGTGFFAGDLDVQVMATPGHTDDSVTYLIGDAAFVGDTLFAPERGTARCDFPGGSADALFDTIQSLYDLPDGTRLFLCHDYPEHDADPVVYTTVEAQRTGNARVRRDTDRTSFVAWREARDAALSLPALIIPALQVNVRGGALPAAESNGIRYLKVPLNQF